MLVASVDLHPVTASVPVARHLVRDLLRDWSAPHDAEDAALLVTELVADVVDHVAGEASSTLQVTLAERWLRISAADGSALRPVVRDLHVSADRGRGMRLVEAVADRWGVEEHGDGTCVWFELAAPGFADDDPRGPAGERSTEEETA
ncbi:ATP-binding protein [Geodermatophilus sp. DSM 44513]|uniref:ATP-binding protein n=1 Tax=Geodermatophilus sp. DSM 44513 TaxID=1528104 RepID=UPI001289FD45|nr:ATP-binding protein [Geodermatophilus sp. DSM 44513]WNV75106.1 ATP-binding protein [Geodermatophilus sp. DSM 44513]